MRRANGDVVPTPVSPPFLISNTADDVARFVDEAMRKPFDDDA